ncbi:pyridoxamine kinase [[Clostridium] aminophilum]|uniref:pyridoxal kinase n=1 Tax=[Clostridium] aminophilum TaxID=1526 RepID=A0A1I6JSC8_9FIRM|nr:pyridoxamine kinase [[Clostridium] aminophilum]SFR81894.1 pyridoxine kinase [[Clostridium] aminophilum]
MKRIVTIQDISCVGKCSLTVALPIISAMGVETAILPTAVLSTHTQFSGFTVKDLQDQIEPISAHWKKEGFHFDAIYTGYLASAEQIRLVAGFFDNFHSDDTLLFVDPAMADNGKLYAGFPDDFPKAMAELCGKADIIVPNLTEACFMTGMEYKTEYDGAYIREVLRKLAALGTKKAVVLTGCTADPGMTGVSGLNVETGEFFGFSHEKLSASYHGTGDIFSSATVGALMRGKTLEESLKIAARFTVASIRETIEHDPEKTYGVDFEAVIPELISDLNASV